jgi:3-hydroxyacyl-CoA dehydrogenase
VHLADIADNARDIDFAMRWGFGWAQGPFETWQAAGWKAIAEAVQADIDAGKAMSPAPLPAWVFRARRRAFAAGSYSASADAYPAALDAAGLSAAALPRARARRKAVERRHGLGERRRCACGRCRSSTRHRHRVSIKSKNHTLGRDVIIGVQEAIRRAEKPSSRAGLLA